MTSCTYSLPNPLLKLLSHLLAIVNTEMDWTGLNGDDDQRNRISIISEYRPYWVKFTPGGRGSSFYDIDSSETKYPRTMTTFLLKCPPHYSNVHPITQTTTPCLNDNPPYSNDHPLLRKRFKIPSLKHRKINYNRLL